MGNYIESRQNGMTGEDPVFRSLEVIEKRIREKLTVGNLADTAHFSKYHYQRMFREAVGDSVMGYVTRRRISLAAAELTETDDSILEIALRYGYDSHEGFTRSFRAHMGITPTEYRKYHLFTDTFTMREWGNVRSAFTTQEGRNVMIYSKAADEVIRELNSLIVQARETAVYARKSVETNTEAAVFYARFWNMMADKTESMADRLAQNLTRVTAIAQQPDEISARFLIIKAMEDTAFQSGIAAFQAGLTIARARPEYREVFAPVCDQYRSLARNARIRTGRIAEFMQELSTLIFQDMRKNAEQKIQQAVKRGMAAAQELSKDPALPYGYISDEVRIIAEELSSMPIEKVTAACLEDDLFRLDMLAFAADVDALRVPAHRALLEEIHVFREEIDEAVEFFQSLPGNAFDIFAEYGTDENDREWVFWGNALLFYLKGEIQKLGDTHLKEGQKTILYDICNKLNEAIHLMREEMNHKTWSDVTGLTAGPVADELGETAAERWGETAAEELGKTAVEGSEKTVAEGSEKTAAAGASEHMASEGHSGSRILCILQQVYHGLTIQAEELGIYGAAIRYLAEELKSTLLRISLPAE